MNLFQDIPIVLQVEVLLNWLRLSDVAHLDSAICTHSSRSQFLDVLGARCIFSYQDTGDERQARWFINRKIRVTRLMLRNSTNSDPILREMLLKLMGPTLENLDLGKDEQMDPGEVHAMPIDDVYFDVAMHCPQIRSFNVWGEKVTGNLNLLVFRCSQLKSLQLEECTNISASTIKAICSAPQLNSLAMSQATFETDSTHYSTYQSASLRELFADCAHLPGEGLIRLCGCFPYLTLLCLGPISGADLVMVAQQCVHVKDANIRLDGVLSDENARKLCAHWAQIELLQLRSHAYESITCSEEAVLVFLRECRMLLKLSVCRLDAPRGAELLYYPKKTSLTIVSASVNTNSNVGSVNSVSTGTIITRGSMNPNIATVHTNQVTSLVTDLFVDSLTEAHLAAIIALCPRLDTLAIRHHTKYTPMRFDAGNTTTAYSNPSDRLAAEYTLHRLNTSSVRKLHLSNIYSLAHQDLASLTQLHELQLCNIGANLNNQTILTVVNNNPNLCSVSLFDCKGLEGSSLILPLLQSCPKLHTFHYEEHKKTQEKSYRFSPPMRLLTDVVLHSFPHVKTFTVRL